MAELLITQFIALADLRESWNNHPIRFSIGAGESLLHWLVLPRLGNATDRLAANRANMPRVVFAVRNLRTTEIREGPRDQSVDFGLLREPEVADEYNSAALGSLEFALFVPRRMVQQLNLASASLETILSTIPLATLPPGVGLRRQLDRGLKDTNGKFLPSLLCESLPQTERALIAGTQGAILPTLASNTQLEKEAVVEFRGELFSAIRQRIKLVWHSDTDVHRLYAPRVAQNLAVALQFGPAR